MRDAWECEGCCVVVKDLLQSVAHAKGELDQPVIAAIADEYA